MRDKTKKHDRIKMAAKVAAILIVAIFVLSVIFKIMAYNSGSGAVSIKRSWAVPRTAGMMEKSATVSSGNAMKPAVAPGAQLAVSDSGSSTGNNIQQKVVKNGNVDMQVSSADQAAAKITQIAKDNGGDVYSSNFYQNLVNSKSGQITVRVPANNFDQAFSDIKKVGTLVVRESTSDQDVTAQYVDLQAQLKNAQAEEDAYTKLLDKAQKMEDIMSITDQLSNVRGQIEGLQGQIRYMDSQTDMATISANISEDSNVVVMDNSWRPWQVVKDSASMLIKSIQGGINFLIRLIIQVIPILLLYAIIIFILYEIGRAIYLKTKKKNGRR